MLLEKSQLLRLKESWKNIIDPRKGYQNGVKIAKKEKLTQIQKMMAETYIEEDDDPEDSDQDTRVDDFIDNQFKDFQTKEILEKTMRQ